MALNCCEQLGYFTVGKRQALWHDKSKNFLWTYHKIPSNLHLSDSSVLFDRYEVSLEMLCRSLVGLGIDSEKENKMLWVFFKLNRESNLSLKPNRNQKILNRAPARLKFSLATVKGNALEMRQICWKPLATEANFFQIHGHFQRFYPNFARG